MLSLEEHLAAAPKTVLAHLRRHWNLASGSVVSNSAVALAVRDRAFDPERLRAFFESATPAQRDVLRAVYGAGERGLSAESLRAAFPSTERRLLDDAVDEFRRELLVARTSGDSPVLHGFRELWPDLADLFADSVPKAEKGNLVEIGYEGFAVQHLLHLFSHLRREPWHYTREGTVKQSERREYDKPYRFGKQISPRLFTETIDGKATPGPGEELVLLLDLTRRLGWISDDGSEIRLRADGERAARGGCRALWTALLETWASARGFAPEALRILLRTLAAPRRARPWCKIWSLREHLSPEKRLQWDGLPQLLRELVVLGTVRLGEDDGGNVEFLGLTQCGAAWSETGAFPAELDAPLPGYATANFEVFVPVFSCGEHVWTLHRTAELTADEQFLKFSLCEEGTLAALRSGVTPREVRELAEWLHLPSHPAKAVEEWVKSFERCRLLRPLLLEVRDGKLREKLMASRPIADWVVCELEGFGLMLRDGAETALPPLLESYGLHPQPPGSEKGAVLDEPLPKRASAAAEAPELDWVWTEPPAEETLRLGEIDLAGSSFAETTPDQKRRFLRYCARNRVSLTLWWREKEGATPKKCRVQLCACDGDSVSGTDEKGREIRVEIPKIANLRA